MRLVQCRRLNRCGHVGLILLKPSGSRRLRASIVLIAVAWRRESSATAAGGALSPKDRQDPWGELPPSSQ